MYFFQTKEAAQDVWKAAADSRGMFGACEVSIVGIDQTKSRP